MNPNSKVDTFLALCCAQISEIPKNLRAAAIKIENLVVWTYFFFENDYSEDDFENVNCINTYALCFPNVTTELIVEKIPYPNPLPNVGLYAFSRDTPMPKSIQRSDMQDLPIEAQAIISICQALLGKVSPNLRAAGVTKTNDGLDIFFFMNAVVSEDYRLIQNIPNEVVADFCELKVNVIINFCPHPQELPEVGRLAFKINEPPILKRAWKENLFLCLILDFLGKIPDWICGISFTVENLVSLRSKGSITFVYLITETDVPIESINHLKEQVEEWIQSGAPTESVKIITRQRKPLESLPETGSYIFSRNIKAKYTFKTEDMLLNDLKYKFYILLAQSLLGKIKPNMRSLDLEYKNNNFTIDFIFDQEAQESDLKLIHEVYNEMKAAFPNNEIGINIEYIPFPEELPSRGALRVYSRYEPNKS